MGATTTAFSTSQEVSGTGYSSGGAALTNVTPTSSSTTAIVDFSDLTFSSSTITARALMIYNDSASGDPAVCVIDFGGDKTSTNGDFTIVFPAATATGAIIRLA